MPQYNCHDCGCEFESFPAWFRSRAVGGSSGHLAVSGTPVVGSQTHYQMVPVCPACREREDRDAADLKRNIIRGLVIAAIAIVVVIGSIIAIDLAIRHR